MIMIVRLRNKKRSSHPRSPSYSRIWQPPNNNTRWRCMRWKRGWNRSSRGCSNNRKWFTKRKWVPWPRSGTWRERFVVTGSTCTVNLQTLYTILFCFMKRCAAYNKKLWVMFYNPALIHNLIEGNLFGHPIYVIGQKKNSFINAWCKAETRHKLYGDESLHDKWLVLVSKVEHCIEVFLIK